MNTLTIAQSLVDSRIWIYIIFLILLVLLGGGLIYLAKRKLLNPDEQTHTSGGGLLEHLDEMKRTGKITKEEYEITRRTIIENASANLKESQNEP